MLGPERGGWHCPRWPALPGPSKLAVSGRAHDAVRAPDRLGPELSPRRACEAPGASGASEARSVDISRDRASVCPSVRLFLCYLGKRPSCLAWCQPEAQGLGDLVGQFAIDS